MLAVFTEGAAIPSVGLCKTLFFTLVNLTRGQWSWNSFCLLQEMLNIVRGSAIHQKAVWWSKFLLPEASLCSHTGGWYLPTQL